MNKNELSFKSVYKPIKAVTSQCRILIEDRVDSQLMDQFMTQVTARIWERLWESQLIPTLQLI